MLADVNYLANADIYTDTMKLIDLTGQTFQYLTVIERAQVPPSRGAYWRCQCVCGTIKEVRGSHITKGKIISCGCIRGSTHRKSYTSECNSWRGMRDRCLNKNMRHYNRYGGRGIRVCERWNRFENFFSDMGEKPSPKHTLDRIDNMANIRHKIADG